MSRHRPEPIRYCAAERCRTVVNPGELMCRAHWLSLPKGLRSSILDSWKHRRMRDYAVFEMGLANLQLKYKHTAEACASYARSQAIFERMGSEGHLSAIDRKTQLGGIVKTRRESCSP